MKSKRLILLMIVTFGSNSAISCAADTVPEVGPATEKRFPPLKVPTGFKATLFASDPLIEYPSVIAVGPRQGAIFVAVDYMTGLGTEIVRRSEVRLVEDTDGDGYADKATVFAEGFNSIMGLAYHDCTLFVMHAPLLTALRDTRGTGVADERKDILTGLGLSPEENPVRLHCANGVTVGHDGWLYLALGDHGCDVKRPEGDRLVFEGGGVLRCRPQGDDLHVFATGLRNIYDVALDDELNVFVRDNENDGGDYKIRFCHSFFGADHGYPYLYYERPLEALPPLADLGLGSSAGGACYLEARFPEEYLANVFFCEWGKSLVRYPLRRRGSSFGSPAEVEFATGADGDPYGFKPTDVIVQRDGSLMVSDYADGQRPKRGRGRIYHIAYVGGAERDTRRQFADALAMLDSESYFERCDAQATIERAGEKGLKSLTQALAAGEIGLRGRLHAVWILVHLQGALAIEPLFAIARSDPEPSVRAQAVRAIADLADPMLVSHRLDAGPGDADLAARLAALGQGQDRQTLLEIIVALGRLRWPGTANWLRENLTDPDAALSHAALHALRQSGNWPAILNVLDTADGGPLRGIALRALAGQYDAGLVEGLLARLSSESETVRLQEYVDCLARVYKKRGPWVYWGYRPDLRPANDVAWERTEAIAAALNRVLTHVDPEVRLATLRQMHREKIPASLATLGKWLSEDNNAQRVATVLDFLRDQPAADVHPYLESMILNPLQATSNRLVALDLFVQGLDQSNAAALLALSERLEDGSVLAKALLAVGKHPQLAVAPLLIRKVNSTNAEVRVAAIGALGELRLAEGRKPLIRLLEDQDSRVRRAAAQAAGTLGERRMIGPLLILAGDSDPLVRAASLDSLRLFNEPRAVPLAVAALNDRPAQLNALKYLEEFGGPEQVRAVVDSAKRHPSVQMLTAAVQVLSRWRQRYASARQQRELDDAVAEIHGFSGSLVRWNVSGPARTPDDARIAPEEPADARTEFATGTEGRIVISAQGAEQGSYFQAQTEIAVSDETGVELLASSSGSLQVWLNGNSIYCRRMPSAFRINSDCFPATFAQGHNRLVVGIETGSPELPVEFHARFRRKSALADHERLAEKALARSGNAEHGREVILNVEKSLCLKCHQVNDQGERIGPELTGLGSRFSRIYITESILEPSRTVAPSFATVVVQLKSGQVLSGIKVAESESLLTLADNLGQKQQVSKADIEQEETSALSTMPEGLEKRMTDEEFVDLIAFLASLREDGAR
jgi:putative heme-binding domain-containing protein